MLRLTNIVAAVLATCWLTGIVATVPIGNFSRVDASILTTTIGRGDDPCIKTDCSCVSFCKRVGASMTCAECPYKSNINCCRKEGEDTSCKQINNPPGYCNNQKEGMWNGMSCDDCDDPTQTPCIQIGSGHNGQSCP